MRAVFEDSFKKLLKRIDNNIIITGYSLINESESDPNVLKISGIFNNIQAVWDKDSNTLNLYLDTKEFPNARNHSDESITDYKSCYGINIYYKLEGGGSQESFSINNENDFIRLNTNRNLIKITFTETVKARFSSLKTDLSTDFLESPGIDYVYNILYLKSISDLNSKELLSKESYYKFLANASAESDYKFSPWINELGELQTENYNFRIYESDGFDAGVSDMRKDTDDGLLTKYYLFRDKDGVVKVRGVIKYTEYNVKRGVITEVGKGTESISGIDGIEIICDKYSKKFRYTIDNSLYCIRYKECKSICSETEIPYGIFHLKLSYLNEFTGKICTVESNKFELVQSGEVEMFTAMHNTPFYEDGIPVYLLDYTKNSSLSFNITLFSNESPETIRQDIFCLYEGDALNNRVIKSGQYSEYMNSIFSVDYEITKISSTKLNIKVILKTLSENLDENHWRPYINDESIPVISTLKVYANEDLYDTKFYMIQKANAVPIEIHDNNILQEYETSSVGKVDISYKSSNNYYIDNSLSTNNEEATIDLSGFPSEGDFYFELKNRVSTLNVTEGGNTYTYKGNFENDFIYEKHNTSSSTITNRVLEINAEDSVDIIDSRKVISINNIEDAGELTINFKKELLIGIYQIRIKNRIYSLTINDGGHISNYSRTPIPDNGTIIYTKWINNDGDIKTLLEVAPSNYPKNNVIWFDPDQDSKELAISNQVSFDDEGNKVIHKFSSDTYWRVIENKLPVIEQFQGIDEIALNSDGSPKFENSELKFSIENGEINSVIPDYEEYINDDGSKETRELTWPSQYKTFTISSEELSGGVQDSKVSYLKFVKLSRDSFPLGTETISSGNWRIAALSSSLDVLILRKGQKPFIKIYESPEATEIAEKIYVKKVDSYPINVRSNTGVRAVFKVNNSPNFRKKDYKDVIKFFGELTPGKITIGTDEYTEKKNNSISGVDVYINHTLVNKYSWSNADEDHYDSDGNLVSKYLLGTIEFEDIYDHTAKASVQIWQDLDFKDYDHTGLSSTDDTIRFYKRDEESSAIEFNKNYNSLASHLLFYEGPGKGVYHIKSSSYVHVIARYYKVEGSCALLGEGLDGNEEFRDDSGSYEETGSIYKNGYRDSRGTASNNIQERYYYNIWPKFYVNESGKPEYLYHEFSIETTSYNRAEVKIPIKPSEVIRFLVDYTLYGEDSNSGTDKAIDTSKYSITSDDMTYFLLKYPVPNFIRYTYTWPDWNEQDKRKEDDNRNVDRYYEYRSEETSHRSDFGELKTLNEASRKMLWEFPRNISKYPLHYYEEDGQLIYDIKRFDRLRVNISVTNNDKIDNCFKEFRCGKDYYRDDDSIIEYIGVSNSPGEYTVTKNENIIDKLENSKWKLTDGTVMGLSTGDSSGSQYFVEDNDKKSKGFGKRMIGKFYSIKNFEVKSDSEIPQIKQGRINIFGTIDINSFDKYLGSNNIPNLTVNEKEWIRGLVYERYYQVRIIFKQQDNIYYNLDSNGVLRNIGVYPEPLNPTETVKKFQDFYLSLSQGNMVSTSHKFFVGSGQVTNSGDADIPELPGATFNVSTKDDSTKNIKIYNIPSRIQKDVYDLNEFSEISTPVPIDICTSTDGSDKKDLVATFYQNGVRNALLYSGEKVKNALFIGDHSSTGSRYVISEELNSLDDIFTFNVNEIVRYYSAEPIVNSTPEIFNTPINYPNHTSYPFLNRDSLVLKFSNNRFCIDFGTPSGDAPGEIIYVDDASNVKSMITHSNIENSLNITKCNYYFDNYTFNNTRGVILDLPKDFTFKYFKSITDLDSKIYTTLVTEKRSRWFFYYNKDTQNFEIEELKVNSSNEELLKSIETSYSGKYIVPSGNYSSIRVSRLTPISAKSPGTVISNNNDGTISIKFQKNEISERKTYQFKVELDTVNDVDEKSHLEGIDSSFILEISQDKFSIEFSAKDKNITKDYIWNFLSDGTSIDDGESFKFVSNNEYLENPELFGLVDTGDLMKSYSVTLLDSESDPVKNSYVYEIRIAAKSRINKTSDISGTIEFHYYANNDDIIKWIMNYNQGHTYLYLINRKDGTESDVQVEWNSMEKYNVGIGYSEYYTKNSSEIISGKTLFEDQSVFVSGDYKVDEYYNVIGYEYDSETKKYKFHKWNLGQYSSNISETSVSLIKEENEVDYEEYSIADSITKTSEIKVDISVTTYLNISSGYLGKYNLAAASFEESVTLLTLTRNYKNV